jgi:nucleotide-binding universal stress UspA family protein
MIKDIVLPLLKGADADVAVDYAVSVAAAFEAHLAGVAFAYETVPAAMLIDDVPPDWIDDLRTEADNAAKAAVARFEEAARRAGIAAESRRLDASFAGTGDLFGRIARRFDLSVVRQAEPDEQTPAGLIITAALFDTGRPVLLVPYIQKSPLALDRAMVCWDGGRNAARAVGDALPFLARAKAVEVVVVGDRPKSDEMSGADIAHHLARHGLPVTLKRIVAPEADVAGVLLSHAADVAATFMIMGGYGHSRLREFVLGGATRGVLSQMTVPTLMSH